MKNKKYIITAILGATILFSSCGSDDKKAVVDNSPAIAVQIKTVSEDSSNPFLTVSGKIEAAKSANISTRMMGYVDKIYVGVGDKVQNGQLLMSVNNADVSAQLAQVNAGITEAEAAYTNAEKDFNRFTTLFKENSASQKELDDITANYNMAKARVESAKQMKNGVNAQMGYANIRAPFNGVVTNKFINAGDMANPGMALMEVESPGTYQVLAMVPESEIIAIKNDTEVSVQIKALNKSIKGKVTEVSTSSKNTGGQYLVKVILDKTDAQVLSGMYATVQFPIARKTTSSAVMIPLDAIVKKGQLSGIYTVSQSNTALLRWLRLGRTFGDQVEVLSGLSADEQYIVSAEGKLFNGAKISNQ
ncbi:efflux RND transporter periplasmic adaptor subunit [Maribacter hydrothermalis]|uniref:Efflux transporter periplasmic adaptor subunit n=1 Tax=Maribacter hydrothermalis TaxID=1836467 RepID=A0A1B7YZ26_9FLAO|nr:efflux RND transporter periplasmic adaptor subunit [Maribacter hydrothermalis]APQ16105.1 efflux transporter periplasmic adaptor subunit [Maribacter hydrothermalis]OBR35718.1 efflux transporter periplasmic adaptor subunit [Maribacter hydrothermalis]